MEKLHEGIKGSHTFPFPKYNKTKTKPYLHTSKIYAYQLFQPTENTQRAVYTSHTYTYPPNNSCLKWSWEFAKTWTLPFMECSYEKRAK